MAVTTFSTTDLSSTDLLMRTPCLTLAARFFLVFSGLCKRSTPHSRVTYHHHHEKSFSKYVGDQQHYAIAIASPL